MCEKKFIWKGESETLPEDLRQASLIGGWEPIEELHGLLTKILQDASQRTRARVCRASASNLNRRLPENPFTRHPGQKKRVVAILEHNQVHELPNKAKRTVS